MFVTACRITSMIGVFSCKCCYCFRIWIYSLSYSGGNVFILFLPGLTSQDQDATTIPMPAPISFISTDISDETSPQKEEPQPDEYKRNSMKLARGKRDRSSVLSPVSASSNHRSPRFKVSIC